MKTYISEYTHVDGSRWAGPRFYADSLEEAQAYAMDYPVQPLRILGELVAEVNSRDDISQSYRVTQPRLH